MADRDRVQLSIYRRCGTSVGSSGPCTDPTPVIFILLELDFELAELTRDALKVLMSESACIQGFKYFSHGLRNFSGRDLLFCVAFFFSKPADAVADTLHTDYRERSGTGRESSASAAWPRFGAAAGLVAQIAAATRSKFRAERFGLLRGALLSRARPRIRIRTLEWGC